MAEELLGELLAKPDEGGCQDAVGIADVLAKSMQIRGCIDMNWMCQASQATEGEICSFYEEAIVLDPDSHEYKHAADYASGNVAAKLATAERAARTDPRFEKNVCLLKEALPARVGLEDIDAHLGAPFVPVGLVEGFIYHLMGEDAPCETGEIGVLHDGLTGSWAVQGWGRFRRCVGSSKTWGTSRVPMFDVVERLLNGRALVVKDEIEDANKDSGKKLVVNEDETSLLIEKASLVRQEWTTWILDSASRIVALESAYNKAYCGFVPPKFDGSWVDPPGCTVDLRPHQKSAIARGLIQHDRSLLFAHDTGTGKTNIGIALAQELRRLGHSSKNLFVVPNAVVGQWEDAFLAAYPGADILVVTPSKFEAKKRASVLADMRDNAYDAIIMAHSSFDMIEISPESQIEALQAEIEELEGASDDPKRKTPLVKRRLGAAREKLEKLVEAKAAGKRAGVYFDELLVDRLFVDESHLYKNVTVGSSGSALGVSSGSKKCDHMLEAARAVQARFGCVYFFTGTVLTNSIAECYIVQNYLAPGTLKLLELESFDAWCGAFACRETSWEVDVDTTNFVTRSRLAGFTNLAQLSAILGTMTDFYAADHDGGQLPAFDGFTDILIEPTPALKAYQCLISQRAKLVRTGKAKRTVDNLLKICIDDRQAAIDPRLKGALAVDPLKTKVGVCAARVAKEYREAKGATAQVVFSDVGTPKKGAFNVYDELKRILVEVHGLPEDEIRFVHEATNATELASLYRQVRSGKVRVLVASTLKGGTGANFQDRLCAAHFIDVPWRPSDLEQRCGRILRLGNMCESVTIYRYLTKGSFDSYSWMLLEKKQKFIAQLFSGIYAGRRIAFDLSDKALSYAEIVAATLDEPMMKERVELQNQISRLVLLKKKHKVISSEMEAELSELPGRIAVAAEKATLVARDALRFQKGKVDYGQENRKALRAKFARALTLNICTAYESVLCDDYMGFQIIAPDHMLPFERYLVIRGDCDHRVAFEDPVKELGVLPRIDNVLEGLAGKACGMRKDIAALQRRERSLGEELAKKVDYDGEIEAMRANLDKIDAALELKKQEKQKEDEDHE